LTETFNFITENWCRENDALLTGFNENLPCFLHFSSDLDKIRHIRWAQQCTEWERVLWKSARGRWYFPCGHKWNYNYSCTLKPRDIWK